jgi:hypothetical protein
MSPSIPPAMLCKRPTLASNWRRRCWTIISTVAKTFVMKRMASFGTGMAFTGPQRARMKPVSKHIATVDIVTQVLRSRAKFPVKYDDALGRRAKVMIGKSQDRLHRHGIFPISRGIRDLAHSGGNGVSTPVMNPAR